MTMVSLDGVMQAPGGWTFPYADGSGNVKTGSFD